MPESPAKIRMHSAEKKAVLRVSGIAIARMLGLFMLLPVLSPWAAGMPGATPLLIGMAVGGYGLTQAALQIPFGRWSDRFGRRPMAFIGLGIFVLGSVLCAFASNIYLLVAGRILQGCGAVSSVLSAWIADVSRPAVRVRANAILGASIGLAYVTAILLGPLLATHWSVPVIFVIGAVLGALAILLVVSTPATPQAASGAAARPLTELLQIREIRPLMLSVFALHTILIAMFIVLPFLLLERFSLAAASHWSIYLIGVLGSLIVVLPMLRRVEGAPAAASLWLAWVLIAAGLSVFSLGPPHYGVALLAAALFFAGFNLLEASLPAHLSLLAPEGSRGAVMGLYATAHFLGAFSGGITGGLLLGWVAPDWRLLILAGIAGLLVVVTLRRNS